MQLNVREERKTWPKYKERDCYEMIELPTMHVMAFYDYTNMRPTVVPQCSFLVYLQWLQQQP